MIPPKVRSVFSALGRLRDVADSRRGVGRPIARQTPAERLEPRRLMAATFAPVETYAVPRVPSAVTAGDFNGDGRPDLAVPVFRRDALAVSLNRGDGSFADPVLVGTRDPRAIAAADFNGDGRADLATLDPRRGSRGRDDRGGASVLLSTGDGTFGPRARYTFSNNGLTLTAADVNGDARPDLLAPAGRRVAVLLNNGDGTFGQVARYEAGGERVRFIAADDFNGDGAADLAVTQSRLDAVAILLGNKDAATGAATGTFGAPTLAEGAGREPRALATGDFNNDGRRDLAVANWGFRINGLSVLPGNGDGTFGPRTPYRTDSFSETVIAADFDGDGDEEIVLGPATGQFQVFDTAPGGALTLTGEFAGSGERLRGTDQAVAADFNGDGKPDLATLVYRRARVGVLLNTTTSAG